jgi:hypothetical protein
MKFKQILRMEKLYKLRLLAQSMPGLMSAAQGAATALPGLSLNEKTPKS